MKSYLLKDLVEIQQGFAFKSKDYVSESNTSSFRMSNIRPGGVVDLNHNLKFLPDIFKDQYKDFLLKEGDLVMAMTDMAQNPKILGIPSIIPRLDKNYLLNQRVARFKYINKDVVDQKYLYYYFLAPQVRKYLISEGSGGLQINLSSKSIYNLQVPVPSLQEQEKIVERLDIIFGKIDNDITNYKKLLIEIGNLFNSNLHSTFVNTEDRHREFFLEGCIKHQRGLTFKKSDVVDYSDLKVLRANNIDYEKYSFIKNDFLYLNPKIQIEDKYFTKKNDIIVCMSTGSRKHLGKVAIIEENIKYVVGGFLGKITANIEVLDPKYLYYFLINPKVKKIIYDSVVSMTINNLRIDILNKLLIPVPNIKEQKKIVENLDKFFDNMTNLTQNYEKIITNFNDLKKSILYKEFSYE